MSARTVYSMLEETAAVHGQKPALKQPVGGGKYRTYTWAEVRDRVQWTAVGLNAIGVEIGDMVALQSETRAEFYFADLGVMNVLINDSIDGRHACYLAYSRPLNTLYLVNDNGDGLLAGQSLATAGNTANSQCSVSWADNPVTADGNNLSLTLNIRFNASFAGNRVFYLAARDVAEGNNTDWQPLGSWTVQ